MFNSCLRSILILYWENRSNPELQQWTLFSADMQGHKTDLDVQTSHVFLSKKSRLNLCKNLTYQPWSFQMWCKNDSLNLPPDCLLYICLYLAQLSSLLQGVPGRPKNKDSSDFLHLQKIPQAFKHQQETDDRLARQIWSWRAWQQISACNVTFDCLFLLEPLKDKKL
jgi:hypothetical protein